MAGLTAARVAADHFEKVTLIERDVLEDSADARKGVPQGRHAHGMLKRGEEILEVLFPGLTQRLEAAGAVNMNINEGIAWRHFGGWKAHPPGVFMALFFTRPLLELEVRRAVMGIPNVQFIQGADVLGLTSSSDRRFVQGVRIRRGGAEETLAADLVIDASGRGSRMPAWLEALGRSKVKETIVTVDVAYSTRRLKRAPPGKHKWSALFVVGKSPTSKRGGILLPVEGGDWLATLVGLLGDHPPTDPAGWLEFARNLEVPDYYEAVKDAEPVTDPVGFKFPSHQRRHYEQMADFPGGLVVLGDSHCSFNPVYAQGMTTSILGAELLKRQLEAWPRAGAGPAPEDFTRKFQRALAQATNDPWAAATGEDFRYPEVQGKRPFGLSAIQWYTQRFHRLSHVDPELTSTFYRVVHMLDPIKEMLKPKIVWKVLKGPLPPA